MVEMRKAVARVSAAVGLWSAQALALAQSRLEDLPQVRQNLDRGVGWGFGFVTYMVVFVALGVIIAMIAGKDVKELFIRLLLGAGLLAGLSVWVARMGVNMPGLSVG